jgi:hypothetical protein
MANQEGLFVVPTPLGGVLVNSSNQHIVPATSSSLALPLSDTPYPKQEFPAVRMAHNAAIKQLMANKNVTRYWRYARIDGRHLPVAISESSTGTQIGAAILSCGLTLCFGGPPTPSPPDPCSEKATSDRQRGYLYELVSEIPCKPEEMMYNFSDPYAMSNFGAGTATQDCLWTVGFGSKSIAPGGGWVNMPWETEVMVHHDWMWLYLYGRKPEVRRVDHGIRGVITVGPAAQRMIIAEREALEALAMEKFIGRAVAVWPPVVANGVIIT